MSLSATDPEPVRLSLHRGGQSEVYRDSHRFRVVVAGRQWGKTMLALVILLKWALTRRDQRFWYVAPDHQMAKDIIWADLKRTCHPSWLLCDPMETETRIKFVTGSEIQLKGADDPSKLRGRKIGGVVLDEYADMKQEAWTESLEPAIGILQSPVLFIGTPKSFNHFYDLFALGQQPNSEWKSWQFKSIDNPFFSRVEIERARATKDPRTFRQEYEASFETIGGRAYYAFNRQTHVKPVALERGVPLCVSFDFNVDPATAILGQRVRDEFRVWREVRLTHRGGEATRAAAYAVKQTLLEASWTGIVRVYGDPSGKSAKTTGPSDHAVVREHFHNAEWRIRSAQPHIKDRIEAINSRCETIDGKHHLAVDPHCPHLIADLEQVTMDDLLGASKQTDKTHLSDCLAYVCEYEWPPRGGLAVAALPGLKL